VDSIRTRCPGCSRLYAVSVGEIHSERPQFKCIECNSRFWFLFSKSLVDQEDPLKIEVPSYSLQHQLFLEDRELKGPIPGSALRKEHPHRNYIKPNESKANSSAVPSSKKVYGIECPKCSIKNPMNEIECSHCGVILEKAQGARDIEYRGSHELIRLWESILADFDNEFLHDKFILACYEKKMLPFASHKYGRILSAQPYDELCLKMRDKILALVTPLPGLKSNRISWLRKNAFWIIGLSIGFSLAIWGMAHPGFGNLAGLMASIFFLLVGFRIFFARHA